MFLGEISQIFNNIFLDRTPLLVASGNWFTKMNYQARLKVIEASSIKEACPQTNLKNIAKRCTGDKQQGFASTHG